MPSPFQTLPRHVVEIVVTHVYGSSRLLFAGYEDKPKARSKFLSPLLWTCRNFRFVVYEHLCRRCKMQFYIQPDIVHPVQILWPSRYQWLDQSAYSVVKEWTIKLSHQHIFDGRVLQLLSSAPCSCIVFLRAHVLDFQLHIQPSEPKRVALPSQTIEGNIREFVQHIRRMVPNIRAVKIQSLPSVQCSSSDIRYLGDLLAQLYQLGHCTQGTSYFPMMMMDLRTELYYGLQRLEVTNQSRAINRYVHLARRNAPTLRSLALKPTSQSGFRDLIQDFKGNFVVYPQLQRLMIASSFRLNGNAEWPVLDSVVPFPSLRSLHLDCDYPFDDDLPFRGNAATLETLYFRVDEVTISMLRTRNVFTPTSHPRLSRVSTSLGSPDLPPPNNAVSNFWKFSLEISPDAPVREIMSFGVVLHCCSSNLRPENHQNIRTLTMQDIVIEFEDAIALVKSLPLLSDLGIGVVVPSLQLWYIPSNELTEHVLSTYSCASIRLKYLLIYRSLVDDIGKICIKYILLMALACPHLTFVAPYSGSYGKFFKLMRKTIYSTTFKKYAPQLERLLTNDYYNGK